MSYEAGARASIHSSKAPSSLGKRPRSLAHSPLRVGSRRNKSGRSQKSASFLKTSRLSPRFSRPALHPRRIWCLLTQQLVRAGTRLRLLRHPSRLSATVITFTRLSRTTRSRRTRCWRSGEAHLAKPSAHNQAATACQPAGRVWWTASWYHLSRVTPSLRPPGRPPLPQPIPESRFPRERLSINDSRPFRQ